MHKLIDRLQKLRFVLFVMLERCKRHKKTCKENNVLLVLGGHMGDILVELSAWQRIIEHMKQQGKQIYVLSTMVGWNVLQMTVDTSGIHYLEGELDIGKGWSMSITRKLFASLKTTKFDVMVCNARDSSLYIIVRAIPANKKYIIVHQVLLSGIKGKLQLMLSTEKNATIILRAPGIPEVEYWQKMLRLLGLPDDKLHIMPIPVQCKNTAHQGKYVTVTLDSMNTSRRWPTDSFIALIDLLLEKYTYDICITGQKLSPDVLSKYDRFASNERFFNLVDKVNLKEWIELIRGAQFHIGVDSGSIHIAASVGTQAFCLTGVWHGMEFMPYHLSEVENTKTPICIYRKDTLVDALDCYGCAPKKRYGYGNAECLAQCNAGKPCLCLSKITPDDVMAAIDHALEAGVIQ